MADDKTSVLLIDDKIEFVSTMKDILASEKYSVITATNVKQALQQFKDAQPDIVILDVNLPDGDGLTLTPRLKKAPRKNKWLPVILMSSDATIDDLVKGYQAGCDDYLTKPTDPRILLAKLAVIRRILNLLPER
ncbi:MAG: response regulator transcription factor [Gammaproteobacteria bacterium]